MIEIRIIRSPLKGTPEVELPDPILRNGHMVAVRNEGAGSITIRSIGFMIDEAPSISIPSNESFIFRAAFGAWWTISTTVAGGGGSIPTGTGFVHITGGVQDGAAKLVDTADINDDQVTYAKMQNIVADSRLLGRGASGAPGDIQELTLGTNLSFTGTVLNAAGAAVDIAQAEANLGSAPLYSGTFDIADGGAVSGNFVLMNQAPGPYTGKGDRADEAEMDILSLAAEIPSNGVVRVYWTCQPKSGPVAGNFKFNYTMGA